MTRHIVADCFHKGDRKAGKWPEWYPGKRDNRSTAKEKESTSKEYTHIASANVDRSDTERYGRHIAFAAISDGTKHLVRERD